MKEGISDKWFAIVNPAAGNGRGLAHWPWISKLLRDHGIIPDYAFTEYKYHAIELTVSAVKQGYRRIISIGGDGTLHEIINGIFIQKVVPTTDISIGIIATGTDKERIRSGAAKRYPEAVRILAEGEAVPQDVGKVSYSKANYKQDRYIANVAGVGLDAYIVKRNNRLRENGRKAGAIFLWKTIRSIMHYRPTGVRIWVDGKPVVNDIIFGAWIGVGSNNRLGMNKDPMAISDDGLFDVTTISDISKSRVIRRLRKFYNGRIYDLEMATNQRGKSIRIESIPEIGLEADGEMLGYSPFEFEIIERAVNILVSKKPDKE